MVKMMIRLKDRRDSLELLKGTAIGCVSYCVILLAVSAGDLDFLLWALPTLLTSVAIIWVVFGLWKLVVYDQD